MINQEKSIKTLLEQKEGSALFIAMAFMLGHDNAKDRLTDDECERMLNNMRSWLSQPIGEMVDPLQMMPITNTYKLDEAIMDSYAAMVDVMLEHRKRAES